MGQPTYENLLQTFLPVAQHMRSQSTWVLLPICRHMQSNHLAHLQAALNGDLCICSIPLPHSSLLSHRRLNTPNLQLQLLQQWQTNIDT